MKLIRRVVGCRQERGHSEACLVPLILVGLMLASVISSVHAQSTNNGSHWEIAAGMSLVAPTGTPFSGYGGGLAPGLGARASVGYHIKSNIAIRGTVELSAHNHRSDLFGGPEGEGLAWPFGSAVGRYLSAFIGPAYLIGDRDSRVSGFFGGHLAVMFEIPADDGNGTGAGVGATSGVTYRLSSGVPVALTLDGSWLRSRYSASQLDGDQVTLVSRWGSVLLVAFGPGIVIRV